MRPQMVSVKRIAKVGRTWDELTEQYQPSAVSQQQQTANSISDRHQPSAVNPLPSANSHQPIAIDLQPTANSSQPSADFADSSSAYMRDR
jgi:hypothetical protein